MTRSMRRDGPSGSREPPSAGLHLHGPWNGGVYESAPRGTDRWILDHQADGWLVRLHGPKGRSRPFHPIHRSCPVEAGQLTGRKMSGLPRGHGSDQVLGLGSPFWKWTNNVVLIRRNQDARKVASNVVRATSVPTMDTNSSMEVILISEGLEHFVFLS